MKGNDRRAGMVLGKLRLLAIAATVTMPLSGFAQAINPLVVFDAGKSTEIEVTSGGSTAGGGPDRFLLVSSFVCFQPGCQFEDAVLRYDSVTGAYLGVHIANIPGPTGMTLHPTTGNLLVACRDTAEVREYDAETGAFIRTFVTSGLGGLFLPQSLAFTAAGNLLVSSNQTSLQPEKINGVIEYDGSTGEFVRVFVNGGFLGVGCGSERCVAGPIGMAFGPNGHLYVASANNDLVIEYDGVTGGYVGYFDTTILDFPTGIAIRPSSGIRPGNILVTSRYLTPGVPTDTHKILEFDKTTRELINPNGILATGLDDPGPLMWGDDGSLLAADRALWDASPDFSDKIVKRHATTGAFVGYATSVHDTHLHYGTGMIYVTVGCGSDAECNDGNACTDDSCDIPTSSCNHVNDNSNDPNDGLFCNGVETACLNGTILRDPPPNCDDGLFCTTDSCNELTDTCDHVVFFGSCAVDGNCFINGSLNPANDCQSCNAGLSQTNWTNRSNGSSCGSPVNSQCDLADTCNGSGVCQANLQPGGSPCGSSINNECTAADSCNGSGTCTTNDSPDGVPCDDGLSCTETDSCAAGVCVGRDDPCSSNPTTPICIDVGKGFACVECIANNDCPDDGMACTLAICDGNTNQCFHVPDNAGCSDGLFCNGAELCNPETGACEGGPPSCVEPLLCNEVLDICVECLSHEDCDDGLVCNGDEICFGGVCTPGEPPPNCCKSDGDCDNGDVCDGVEVCINRKCIAGEPLDCNDSNDCTSDVCDAINGCANIDKPAGAACGDPTETLCNHADTCNGEGVCQANIEPNGTSCSDGAFCNGAETCQGGICQPGSQIPQCCDTGDDCNNGNICDGIEQCIGKVCVNGSPLNCDDDNDCTTDSCHPVFGCQFDANPTGSPCGNQNSTPCDAPDTCDGEGDCKANRSPNGTPCPDGNGCNGDESCQNFVCTPGVPLPNCCVIDADCSNGTVCDGIETCVGGACVAGIPLNCEDGNPCTNSACDPLLGCLVATLNPPGTPCGNQRDSECDHPDSCNASGLCDSNLAANGSACPDGVFCNGEEQCQNGVCTPGAPVPNCCANNGDCDNNSVCDGEETCSNATCVPGTPLNCNDDNPCTDDFCDPVNGCGHANNSSLCDDGVPCTSLDTCVNGACQGGGNPPDCNDGECTDCNANDVRDDCEDLGDCDGDSILDVCEPNGDADSDCDSDLRDFASFQNCFTGEGAVAPPSCSASDVDFDEDVDLDDLATVIGSFDGP